MPQSLAQVYLHIIFSTKHRYPFLSDNQIRKEAHAYIASVLHNYGSYVNIVGGVADHIHILCTLPKEITYPKLIGETKRNSSKWIKTKAGPLTSFYWQNGYGTFSVSHSKVPQAHQYIVNQEEHHRKTTFQEEFRVFMKKHGIEFDERYVWD
jgi:putative transposase